MSNLCLSVLLLPARTRRRRGLCGQQRWCREDTPELVGQKTWWADIEWFFFWSLRPHGLLKISSYCLALSEINVAYPCDLNMLGSKFPTWLWKSWYESKTCCCALQPLPVSTVERTIKKNAKRMKGWLIAGNELQNVIVCKNRAHICDIANMSNSVAYHPGESRASASVLHGCLDDRRPFKLSGDLAFWHVKITQLVGGTAVAQFLAFEADNIYTRCLIRFCLSPPLFSFGCLFGFSFLVTKLVFDMGFWLAATRWLAWHRVWCTSLASRLSFVFPSGWIRYSWRECRLHCFCPFRYWLKRRLEVIVGDSRRGWGWVYLVSWECHWAMLTVMRT